MLGVLDPGGGERALGTRVAGKKQGRVGRQGGATGSWPVLADSQVRWGPPKAECCSGVAGEG